SLDGTFGRSGAALARRTVGLWLHERGRGADGWTAAQRVQGGHRGGRVGAHHLYREQSDGRRRGRRETKGTRGPARLYARTAWRKPEFHQSILDLDHRAGRR